MSEPRMVRPFAMVGGRTRTDKPLALESLALATESGRERRLDLSPDLREVVDLCARARSVAEVSALMGIPLAVAKVLVADARDARLVEVHRTSPVSAPSFLEEVLDAFRAL